MGIRCARTGCRDESNAREIKLTSRIFSFRKVFFLIYSSAGSTGEYATKPVQRNRVQKRVMSQSEGVSLRSSVQSAHSVLKGCFNAQTAEELAIKTPPPNGNK